MLTVVVLSAGLAAAIVYSFILYQKYVDTKDALIGNEEELLSLNEKITQANGEISVLSNQISKNIKELKELKNSKNLVLNLQGKVKTKDQTLSDLREKIHKIENASDVQKKTEGDLRADLSSKDVIINELQEKLKISRSELLDVQNALAKNKALFDNTVKSKDQSLAELNEKIQDLENALKDKKKVEEDLRAAFSSRGVLVIELQEGLKSSQSLLLDAQNALAKNKQLLDNALKSKDLTLAELNEKIRELVNAYEEKKKIEKDLQGKLKISQSELYASRNELGNTKKILDNTIKSKDLTLAELKEKIRQLEVVYREKEKIEKDLQGKLKISQSELLDIRNELAKTKKLLDNTLKSKDTTLAELNEKIRDLMNAHEEKKKVEIDLQGKLEVSKSELLDIRNELAKTKKLLDDTIRSKDTTLAQLHEKIRDLVNGFEEKKKTEEDLQKTLKISQSELLDIRNELTKTKKLLDDTIRSKDTTLAQLHEKIQDLKNANVEKKRIEKTLRADTSSKDSIIDQLQERLKASRSSLRSVDDEIGKRKTEIEKLKGDVSDLKGKKALTDEQLNRLKSTYEALVSDLKKQMENQEVTIRSFQEKISVTFVNRILFELGKAHITTKGMQILKKVGHILKSVQDKRIRVIGHTDNIPITRGFRYKFPSNWELSAARAAAVVRYFQNNVGLDPGKLEVVGQSFYAPLASNETKEGRAQNRRVNIIIAPKME